ncbi:hypothetical protein D6D28_10456, partial [Aureobasidium pullulans]
VEDTRRLRAIHVSGTNGKGSVCAFISSFLKAFGQRSGHPLKIGLYTSPHMKTIRERIRINDSPISETAFTERFFQVWDSLPLEPTPLLDIPRYLQLLALTSLHHFLEENVDVAILETHLGGEYDATNIISGPLVTAVASVGLDHVRLLGPALEDIAWHKAGIFKSGTPAFSALQNKRVSEVLRRRAKEVDVSLTFVGHDSTAQTDGHEWLPDVQKANCSLALAVTRAWLQSSEIVSGSELSLDDIAQGIKAFSWPGRFQVIFDKNLCFFLDGAHNEMSVPHAARWFAERCGSMTRNRHILIFSHFSDRDGNSLLECLARTLHESQTSIHHVIMTSYEEKRDKSYRPDRNLRNRSDATKLEEYAKTWRRLDSSVQISIQNSIEDALKEARSIADTFGAAQALVVGSLHLVSGALCLLEPDGVVYCKE